MNRFKLFSLFKKIFLKFSAGSLLFSLLIIPIINAILHYFAGNIPLNATLEIGNIIILVALSIVLTLIGGLIPAKKASKKDPVIALRTE